MVITAGILLVTGFVGCNTLSLQLGYLKSAMTDEPGMETQSITFLFVLFMIPVSLLLFVIELWWKRHSLVCLILTGLLVAGSMTGIPSSYLSIFLLLLFMVSYAVIQEGRLTGAADEATASGQIGKGNDYKTGTVQIELETGDMPTESMYLGGFSGSDYLGGAWLEDDDNGLLTQAAHIEVTPSTDGSIRTSYPGFDSSRLEQILARHQWNANTFIPVYEKEEIREIEQVEEEVFAIIIPWEKIKEYFPIIITDIIYTILLIPFMWDYRRLKRLWKIEGMDRRNRRNSRGCL